MTERIGLKPQDNKFLDVSKFERLIIYGNGLIDKNIRNQDKLFYQEIDKHTPIYQQINNGNILLFKTGKIYYCRIFEQYVNNSLILECYYTSENGEKIIEHISEENVIGIVKYLI